MSDDQLDMLLQQLMAVQQQKTNPLSQRTVAQIMLKLYKQNFQFYSTTDGNEYVTPQQVDKQLKSLILERGKVLIGIIPQMLNLNDDVIQARSNVITHNGSIIKHNNFLLSQQQLNSLIFTLKQRLEIQGKLELQEIATSNQFNMIFTRKLIQQNIVQLNAQLINNQLLTLQYREMQSARVLGYLNAIHKPINVDTLVKNANFQKLNLVPIIEQLINSKKIIGKYQNNYFIPQKFAINQKKIINKFFNQNGYLDIKFLQKNFISNHYQQWLKKNLQKQFIFFGDVCLDPQKLDNYKVQLQSLLKGQGLFCLSNIIPFQLDDRNMNKFLTDYCKLTNFLFNNGYCYSYQWLDKCVQQFRDKIIYNIFFKKIEQNKKKGNKKNKQQQLQINQQQLIQTLFDGGLAQYSVLQQLASYLLPVLNIKLQQLKIKCQKQLGQNRGIINSGFLKYKKCKTILKSQENLKRILNTIQKQQKKGLIWHDPDFGPNQKDKLGIYSLVYYDGVPYKNWPPFQQIVWISAVQQQLQIPFNCIQKSQPMKKLQLAELLQIFIHYNQKRQHKLPTVLIPTFSQKKQPPFAFQFYISQSQKKIVLVDQKIPKLQGKLFGTNGIYSLIQKAYAKLRYCYKAILSVGIHQLIFQMTGQTPIKILVDKNIQQKIREEILEKLKNNKCVIGLGQGQINSKIIIQGVETQFDCQKPYLLQIRDQNIRIYPCDGQKDIVSLQQIVKMFKNFYII